MVFLKDWEDFEMAAESMYTESPSQCRFTMKYVHSKAQFIMKLTDNVKCVQFKTERMPDLKKVERFTGSIMEQMTCAN